MKSWELLTYNFSHIEMGQVCGRDEKIWKRNKVDCLENGRGASGKSWSKKRVVGVEYIACWFGNERRRWNYFWGNADGFCKEVKGLVSPVNILFPRVAFRNIPLSCINRRSSLPLDAPSSSYRICYRLYPCILFVRSTQTRSILQKNCLTNIFIFQRFRFEPVPSMVLSQYAKWTINKIEYLTLNLQLVWKLNWKTCISYASASEGIRAVAIVPVFQIETRSS